MATLSTQDRTRLWRGFMRYISRKRETLDGMLKPDLQDAVNAADDWADAAAGSFNSALPDAFRTNATASQKALLLAIVVLMRYDVETVRNMLGDID